MPHPDEILKACLEIVFESPRLTKKIQTAMKNLALCIAYEAVQKKGHIDAPRQLAEYAAELTDVLPRLVTDHLTVDGFTVPVYAEDAVSYVDINKLKRWEPSPTTATAFDAASTPAEIKLRTKARSGNSPISNAVVNPI
jgi:hypothetical protein